MLPPRQTRGFMLVRKPEKLYSVYKAIHFQQQDQEYFKKLRAALSFIDPKNYRGISREPLKPWTRIDEDLLREEKPTLIDLRRDEVARRKFLDINGEDRDDWDSYVEGWDYNQALTQDLSIAEELQKIVDLPEDFEIIEVARDTFGTEYSFLGFDIGYWSGDYFSLICDSMVMPQWHFPASESFKELEKFARCLSEHVLFPNIDDAEKFRKYYRSQAWAEEEYPMGEFCVIQVAAVSRIG